MLDPVFMKLLFDALSSVTTNKHKLIYPSCTSRQSLSQHSSDQHINTLTTASTTTTTTTTATTSTTTTATTATTSTTTTTSLTGATPTTTTTTSAGTKEMSSGVVDRNNNNDDDGYKSWKSIIRHPEIIKACTLDSYFDRYYFLSELTPTPLPYTTEIYKSPYINTGFTSNSSKLKLNPRTSRYKQQVLQSKTEIPFSTSVFQKYAYTDNNTMTNVFQKYFI